MELPVSRWFDAIFLRRSRRIFDPRPVEPGLLEALQSVCIRFRPFPSARAVVADQSPEPVFKGAVGPYGKVKGAPAFIAFIGATDDSNIQEKMGYLGEGLILEATALGLATCWVGGLFRPLIAASLVGIGEGERIVAVTPIGYAPARRFLEEEIMSGFGRNHRRKPLTDLVSGLEEENWPDWMKVGLHAAGLAPSAVNRQPWRFQVEPESITVSVNSEQDTFHISKRLDCGIAMLHLEVGLRRCGLQGGWEFLKPPRVGRFRIAGPQDGKGSPREGENWSDFSPRRASGK